MLVKSKPHPLKESLDFQEFPDHSSIADILASFDFPNPNVLVNGSPTKDLDFIPDPNDEVIVINAPQQAGVVQLVVILASAAYSYTQQRRMQQEQDRLDGMNEALNQVSQSQSIKGGKNRPNKYGVVPVVLGKHLVTPFYAANPLFLRNGTETEMFMLFCVGYGPLKITDIKIGNTLLHDGTSYSGNFSDVEIEILEGRATDPARTIYPFATDTQVIDTLVDIDSTYTTATSATDATEVHIVLQFHEGLYRINKDGKVRDVGLFVDFEYKKTTDVTWTTETVDITARAPTQYFYTYKFDGDGSSDYDVRVRTTNVLQDQDDKFFQFKLYEVTTLQTGSDPIQMDADVATIGLRIKKTDQFVDYIDQLNCVAQSYVTDWDSSEVLSKDPALMYRHLLQGPFNANPLPDSRIDLTGLEDWSDNCETKGYECNAVIDFSSTLKKLLDDVSRCGRAEFGFVDNKFSAVMDDPNQTPVQTFTQRNSFNFQGAKNFTDHIHAVKVRYVNEGVGYQRDEWIVYDVGYTSVNATEFESVDAWGITTPANAERLGRYILASRRLRREAYKISTDFENLICTRGDVVNLNHDVMSHLGAGRITAISGSDITVDDTSFDDSGAGPFGVLIRKADGTTITRNVVSVSSDTITLSSAPTGAAVGDLFTFGDQGSEAEECIVTDISYGHDYKATLTLVPAAPSIITIEDGALPTFPPDWDGDPEDLPPLPPQATIINVITDYRGQQVGTQWVLYTQFFVAVRHLSGAFDVLRYEVQHRIAGDTDWDLKQVASNAENVYAIGPIERGSTYEIRARAVNASGAGPWSTTYTITADELPPSPVPDVSGLELFEQGNNTDFVGRDAKFAWRKSAIQEWIEMGYEATTQGAGTSGLDAYFKDYEVKIYNTDDTLRRRELVTDNFYIYSWEKNYEDAQRLGESSPQRQFKISIIQRSRDNQESANAAVLTVQNPAPTIPAIQTAPGYNFFSATYTAPTDPDWKGVRVYMSSSSGFSLNDTTLVMDGPDTTIMVGNLNAGATYYYQYVPYDSFGAGTASGELSFSTGALTSADMDDTPPTDPSNLVLSSGVEDNGLYTKSYIDASWDASTDDGILTGYFVEVWDDVNTTKSQTFTNTTSFKITDAVPGRTYSVRVQAEDWAGNTSNWTATETQLAEGDTTAPANVTGLTATAGLDKVILNYTNPSDDDFAAVKVHRGTSAGFTPSAGNLITVFPGKSSGDSEVIDANVTNGTDYYYKTITVDVSGNESAASAAVGPAQPFKLSSTNVSNYMETAAIGSAYIDALDAGKITTGTLSAGRIGSNSITSDKINVSALSAIAADVGTVTAGIIQGVAIQTDSVNPRVRITSGSGVEAWNSSGSRTALIAPDGSGYLGLTNPLQWTAAGVVTVPGTLISGEVVGKDIKTAASGWRIELNATGLKYWNGTSTNFNLDASGNLTLAGSITFGGTLTGNTSSSIAIGKPAYSSATAGIWMGYDTSAYKFDIGNSTNYIRWDGSALTIASDKIGSGAAAGGANSIAFGASSSASGATSVAIGELAVASNSNCVAIGYTADATAIEGVAIGQNAQSTSAGGVAIGHNSSVTTANGVAIGRGANVDGQSSVAVGYASQAAGQSIAIGHGAVCTSGQNQTIAIGYNTYAYDQYGITIGTNSTSGVDGATSATHCTAVGYSADANGAYATAYGALTDASGDNATCTGQASSATADNATAYGHGANATATNSWTLGQNADSAYSRGGALGAGVSSGAANEIAIGSSSDDIQIDGDFTVSGSKSFKIPHPTKSDHWLHHSAYEGDIGGGNIYRRTVTTVNNTASLTMDDWFAPLNKDVVVFVQADKHFGRAYAEANGNQITVTSDQDGVYQLVIFGTRQDGATDDFEAERPMYDSQIFKRDYITPLKEAGEIVTPKKWKEQEEKYKQDKGKDKIDDGATDKAARIAIRRGLN